MNHYGCHQNFVEVVAWLETIGIDSLPAKDYIGGFHDQLLTSNVKCFPETS